MGCSGLFRSAVVQGLVPQSVTGVVALVRILAGCAKRRGRYPLWSLTDERQALGQRRAARRVAMKMGRRPRCSPVTYRFRYAPAGAA